MTVRAKILGGFIFIFSFGLILGIAGIISNSMLTSLSNDLYSLQKQDSGVSGVLSAHYVWRQTLTEAAMNGTEFTGSVDPTTCALGKWKDSDDARAVSDDTILSLLRQIDDSHNYIHKEAQAIKTLLEGGQTDEAQRILTTNILPKTQETINILTSMSDRYASLIVETSEEIINIGNTARTIVLSLIILAAVTCLLFALAIIRSIMRPLQNITKAATTIASGDLNVEVSYSVNDQIGELARAFQNIVNSTREQIAVTEMLANGDLTASVTPRSDKDAMNIALKAMIANLSDMFRQITIATSQVSSGSRQIASGAQTLAQGSTEQASAVQELSASIGDIASKTSNNATIAREASDLSDSIKGSAQKGTGQMDQMMRAVEEINDASAQIEKVIRVIDDIAFQTNILALNAAVEAARAGTAGKGFAVVAEEVRNLAAKSADAAKDTSSLIENSVEKAKLGLEITMETSESLREIVEGINRSAEIVLQIAQSSDEQAGAISQINVGIDQVAQVIQQNTATAQESAAASQQMSGQSSILENLVDRFKLENDPNSAKQLYLRSENKY